MEHHGDNTGECGMLVSALMICHSPVFDSTRLIVNWRTTSPRCRCTILWVVMALASLLHIHRPLLMPPPGLGLI